MPASPIVMMSEVSKRYQSNGLAVEALKAVNLRIEAQEFLAVVGASGSGKTTLLNLLGLLDAPTAGQILIDGVDVSALRGDRLAAFRRTHIGFIFQSFNLLPAFTALENVMLPAAPYQRRANGALKARASELLGMVKLDERTHHFPTQLSGGEQQRVAIARALIQSPRLILADEPTGNLDSRSSHDILDLLKLVNQEQNVTVVLVTHNAELAKQADRTVRLHDGMLVDA